MRSPLPVRSEAALSPGEHRALGGAYEELHAAVEAYEAFFGKECLPGADVPVVKADDRTVAGSCPRPSRPSSSTFVDERNEPVGRVERAAAVGERVNFRTVHVFVFDLSGQLLLQRLGADRAENGLRWGSSVAGYLHAGEGYLEAAVRRMQEEIAIIAPLAEVGVLGVPAEGGVQGVPADAGTKFVGLFTARSGDEPKIGEPGHIERHVQQHPSSYPDLPPVVVLAGTGPSGPVPDVALRAR